MKRLFIGLAALGLILAIAFFVLLSGSSADNAPQDIKTIDLADTYEK